MTTAREIVKRALQKNGTLTKTETPSADEASDGLAALNAMLSSWSTESMLITARTWENFSITGANEYTIGPSQTLNTVRPTYIVAAKAKQGNIEYPITPVPDESYVSITDKTTPGTPKWLNYDNGYPVGRIRLYPVPDGAYTLFLLTEKPLTEFDLDTVVTLPPGWEHALVHNLAVLLAPEYGQPVDGLLLKIAGDSKRAISTAIMKNRTMDVLPQSLGSENIYTGWIV